MSGIAKKMFSNLPEYPIWKGQRLRGRLLNQGIGTIAGAGL